VVTYNHFTVPRWMAGRGGWRAEDAPGRFADYAARVTQHFGDLLSWVCTLNEPNLVAMMRSTGVLAKGTGDRSPATEPVEEGPAGVGGYDPARYRMGIVAADLDQMARSHRLAGEAIWSANGGIRVGWTLALVDLQSAEGGEERWLEASRLAQTDWLAVSADDDFVGVQTYSRTRIGADGQPPVPAGTATMQTGWGVYPEALGHTVRLAAEHAGVPVLVTENGMATDDDGARHAYTRAALEGLAE
jgi:beta-glucosidase